MPSTGKTSPGFTGECHPDVFTKPLNGVLGAPKKDGQMSDEQLLKYYEDGFIVIEDFFQEKRLDDALQAVSRCVEVLAKRLVDAGKLDAEELHADADVWTRLTKLNIHFPGAGVLLAKWGAMTDELRQIWSDDRLLNLMEQIVGPDISGHPVHNLRVKIPSEVQADVPWHQDSGYYDNRSYGMNIPTIWLPFLDTNEQNGCMQFARGGHRKGLVAPHTCCHSGTWYISLDDKVMKSSLGVKDEDIITVPVKKGSFILFQNMVPHRSLPNRSDKIRWSVDLRYQATGDPDNFFGLKKHQPFRVAGNPDFKIDWSEFIDWTTDEKGAKFRDEALYATEEERAKHMMDTTVFGPWMRKWPLEEHNRHTDNYKEHYGDGWLQPDVMGK